MGKTKYYIDLRGCDDDTHFIMELCTINLFAHTHQQTNFYNDIPFMYHVGLDSHNCYPVLIDDVIEEIKAEARKCKNFL